MSTDTTINNSLNGDKKRQSPATVITGGNDDVSFLSPSHSPDAKICNVFRAAVIERDSDGACLVKSENATS